MARGLRDYLIRLAEDDGALIRDSDDPSEDLLRALGAHPGEAELVRASIQLLRQDGFLSGSARSIFVRNLPTAQAWEPRESPHAAELPAKPGAARSSNERVREFRARQRDRKRAESDAGPERAVTSSVTDGVTSAVTSPAVSVTDSVTSTVTSSRGSRNIKSSDNFLDLQEDKETDLLLSSTRASAVTSTVTSSVTADVTSSVSVPRARDEDDEDKSNFGQSWEELLSAPIGARANKVREQPAIAAVTHPQRWPEIAAVAQTFALAAGLPEQRLGEYDRDSGVRALVALYAAGFTQAELEHVAAVVPKQSWWSASGKRLGLSSLSIEVARRNLPGVGPPREASPTVAKVLANVQRRRQAG